VLFVLFVLFDWLAGEAELNGQRELTFKFVFSYSIDYSNREYEAASLGVDCAVGE
jgi:hypothetical protein